ncbi:hypothetical protein PybrP1_009745 [[Pythium] brassicae (nom. inval.)]|nr:hypothetical protein PybrP1_009745 [[Pythium] brassicae (nom. inval.)]
MRRSCCYERLGRGAPGISVHSLSVELGWRSYLTHSVSIRTIANLQDGLLLEDEVRTRVVTREYKGATWTRDWRDADWTEPFDSEYGRDVRAGGRAASEVRSFSESVAIGELLLECSRTSARASVDTNASSPAKSSGRRDRDASDSDSDSDERRGRESADDSDSDASSGVEMPLKMAAIDFRDADAAIGDEEASDDSDEPPEIPGSPLAAQDWREGPGQSRRTGAAERSTRQRQLERNSEPNVSEQPDILRIRHDDSNASESGDDEYLVRSTEQPRSAEFHASSSSSESDSDSDEPKSGGSSSDDGDDNNDSRHPGRPSVQLYASTSRPKTAAKELDLYRDAVPDAFFQQIGGSAASANAPSEALHASQDAVHRQKTKTRGSKVISASHPSSNNGSTAATSAARATELSSASRRSVEYAVPVPQEVENLFHFVDEYAPETIEIETRLEPFVPDFIPTIGLPFDGIQIPRPDGKLDAEIGLQTLKEPSATSNVAELELMLQSHVRQQRRARARSRTLFVHSIIDAEHRPNEIDLWIESVARVQSSKPFATVVYKNPMPALESLMELWPEEVETFLNQSSVALGISSLSTLDMSLDELVKIVCVVLDIPVHAGRHVESLHVLFNLYHEIEGYERDLERRGSIR